MDIRLVKVEQQKTSLTLRRQRGYCRNIKEEPQIFGGASLAQVHGRFSSGCGFMVGIDKPKLCTKFEVHSFSHCVNIEVEPQNFGELP